MRECLSLSILLSVLFSSCGTGDDTETVSVTESSIPMVLVTFEDFPANTVLPWSVREVAPDSSVNLGMLATDHTDVFPDVVSILTGEAAREGRLLLLVDCPGVDPAFHQRESMRIVSGSDSIPLLVEPDGIRADLEGFDWTDPIDRQIAVIELMSMNLPDLVIIRTSGLDPAVAREICRLWMEQTLPGRIRVSFYSPPESTSDRGWVILAGPGIRNGNVIGMTPLDYLATLRILTGLPWEPSISQGVPGIASLMAPPVLVPGDGSI